MFRKYKVYLLIFGEKYLHRYVQNNDCIPLYFEKGLSYIAEL